MTTQSYSDFEREYHHHLSKIRNVLAQPSQISSSFEDEIQIQKNNSSSSSTCLSSLESAKQCLHAMLGIAEIEGDPFKIEETTRKLQREVGPLEKEIQQRAKQQLPTTKNNYYPPRQQQQQQQQRRTLWNTKNTGTTTTTTTTEGDLQNDLEIGEHSYEEDSLTTPLTSTTFTPTTPQRQQQQQQQQQQLPWTTSEYLLQESQALCATAEQVAGTTLETLGRQREQLERSTNLLWDALENTEEAKRIMKEMARRALKNKVCLYVVIGLLLFANGAMMIHLWRRK